MMTYAIPSYLRWLVLSITAIFLIACKPTAEFSYTPSQPKTDEVITFDATASKAYKPEQGNAIGQYVWDFGNGKTYNGPKIEHSYEKAGTYTVALTVTDLTGQASTINKKVTVKQGEALTIEKDIPAIVRSSNGASLKNAIVTINGQTALTDKEGKTQLKVKLPKTLKQVVVTFEKEGFITQSILVDTENLHGVTANLLAVKQIVAVANIEKSQTIVAEHLNAQIKFSENSFVRPDGTVVTGKVNVELTPWDITNDDLNAMPANGVARDQQGNIVNLISAGMITATFRDESGLYLQLAQDKTAEISMDLPLENINNQAMTIGTEIPMWHFNEDEGLWVEDGIGQVVESAQSKTGLAVHATVAHFSTWNWDFKFDNPGSVFVQCKAEDVAIDCELNARVKLQDGSQLNKSNYIRKNGTTIINMPNAGTIQWDAQNAELGLIGQVSSGTSGNVVIQLEKPKTDNYVECKLPNGESVACQVTVNDTHIYNIGQDGSHIMTNIVNAPLMWKATTVAIPDANGYARYEGQITSDTQGHVTINLIPSQRLETLTISVKCIASSIPELTGKPCKIQVLGYRVDDTNVLVDPIQEEYVIATINSKVGDTETITIPLAGATDLSIQAEASVNGHEVLGYAWLDKEYFFEYHNKLLEIELAPVEVEVLA